MTSFLGGGDILLLDAGDSLNYHTPKIQGLINFDYDYHIANTGFVFHLLNALYIKLFFFGEISTFSLLTFNITSLTLCGIILHKIKLLFNIKSPLLFLLLFNPFVLNWSSAVMKESLHICLFLLVFFCLIKKRFMLFAIFSILLIIDRPYTLFYISILPFFLYDYKFLLNYKLALFGFLVFFLIDHYIGIDTLLNINSSLQNTLYENRSNASLFVLDNPYINLTKVFLSPFPLRSFTYDSNYFYELHFIFTIFFAFLFIRIIKYNWLPALFIILFNLFLFPHEPRQKLTYLLPLFIVIYHIYKYYSFKTIKTLYQ